MLLWTLGKKLEDEFDGANRRNLLHFINENYGTNTRTSQMTIEGNGAMIEQPRGLTYVSRVLERSPSANDTDEYINEKHLIEKRELVRISTCAIFHKYTRGPGVPHTFVGFIRQWPALPQVVVFLSVCVLPIATIPAEEQYVVRKVKALGGIYGVTYYLGFRDEFNVDCESLANEICKEELLADPNASGAWLSEIKTLLSNATHIVPHYHVVSKAVGTGFFSPARNFLRRIVIEDVYRRIASMFPETENWITPADEIIHVGITARI
jgi:KUP system potassium uptake protein